VVAALVVSAGFAPQPTKVKADAINAIANNVFMD
jgi:hypothetical protein